MSIDTLKIGGFTALAWIGSTLADVGGSITVPDWIPALERLGSFALVAFIVWHYATQVIPEMQKQYLAAIKQSHDDFLLAAKEEREAIRGMQQAFEALRKDLEAHVMEARAVWQARGDLTKVFSQGKKPEPNT